ncbi:hypothetical protein TNCV_3653161 [Trichonephila clavipes]|nr:hypothetical protein TNCV_3653161 [Trichonephila clavipes]
MRWTMDLVILNICQVTRTTPELSSSPNFRTTPMGETILPAAESSDFARHLVLVLRIHVQTSSTLATAD